MPEIVPDPAHLRPVRSCSPRQRFHLLKFFRFSMRGFAGRNFSNVLEHRSKPDRLLESIPALLNPAGKFHLSSTNWLSPWGGHEFFPPAIISEPGLGYSFYTKVLKKSSQHVPVQNLFPTYIGRTLKESRRNSHLRILRIAPRCYPEFSFLMRLPVMREFLAWNCAMLIERRG